MSTYVEKIIVYSVGPQANENIQFHLENNEYI